MKRTTIKTLQNKMQHPTRKVEDECKYPLEEGIELPKLEREKKYNFGLETMDIGQSRFVPMTEAETPIALRNALYNYTKRAKKERDGEVEFKVREMENAKGVKGYRVFCVEPDGEDESSINRAA